MATQKQDFLTPVGRLVQGDPFEKQTKNMQGQPLMTQAGVATQRYFIGVAFAKNDPAFQAFWQLLDTVAKQSFPQLFDAQGRCTHPRFSWKLTDGDGVDDNGKPNKEKEGFAGHWVVKFSSSFPPRCFYQGRYAPQEQIQDSNVIRRGYFVRVAGTIEGNANPQKPGLYVNLNMVELSAQGPEIVSGPDASQVFGGAPAPALPSGATALPGAGAPAMPGMPAPGSQQAMPGLPGAPAPTHPYPAAPAPAPAPVAPPAALPVMPNPQFAAGPGGATPMPGMPAGMPAAPAMPAPPAASGPQVTSKWPQGITYQQMVGNGWTEASLRQEGYIV